LSKVQSTNLNNLIEDGTCSATLSGDPLLSGPANFGGETLTFALLPGSPALEAGDTASCPATDQRGISRPQGSGCDIGAFESQGFTLMLSGGEQSTLINTAFAEPLAITVTANVITEPVGPGGIISFTGPASGASIAPAVVTATT